MRKKKLPPEHPHLADYYNNVSYSYSCLGDPGKAMDYQLKALDIRERVLLPNHPDIALSCNNVAWLYHTSGNIRKAAYYMRRAADIISISSLPDDHPERVNYTNWADQFEKESQNRRE